MDYDLYALGTTYGIPIIKALLILIVGWFVAKFFAYLIKKLLDKTDVDNRIAAYVTGGRAKSAAVEKGISELVRWTIMLFVLMAVFQSLGLTIITEPLNAMLTKFTSFLPHLLAAAVLTGIAWLVATVLRIVVRNLLSAFDLDRKIGESTGDAAATTAATAPAADVPPAAADPAAPAAGAKKPISLASTLADGVYYLVFLLFLPQILDALEMDGLSPVKDMVGEIINFLPNLLGAAVVFFIFYLVARIVQRLVTNLLAGFGFDRLPEWLGFGPPKAGTVSASVVVGYVVLIVILFLGAVQAFNTLGLAVVSVLANELLEGMFDVLVAIVIFAVGLFLSRLAHRAIESSGHAQAGLLANVARFAIIVLTGAMALHKTDLAPEIVNLAFGALIVGIALAGGLAFGLGGRETASRIVESWRQSEEADIVKPSDT